MENIYDKINSRLLSIRNQMNIDKLFIKNNPQHPRVFILNNDIDKSIVAINQLEWVLSQLCGYEQSNDRQKFYCSVCNNENPCSRRNFGIECDGETKFKNQTI